MQFTAITRRMKKASMGAEPICKLEIFLMNFFSKCVKVLNSETMTHAQEWIHYKTP